MTSKILEKKENLQLNVPSHMLDDLVVFYLVQESAIHTIHVT